MLLLLRPAETLRTGISHPSLGLLVDGILSTRVAGLLAQVIDKATVSFSEEVSTRMPVRVRRVTANPVVAEHQLPAARTDVRNRGHDSFLHAAKVDGESDGTVELECPNTRSSSSCDHVGSHAGVWQNRQRMTVC